MAPANSYFVVTATEGFADGACASYDLTVDLPFAPNVAEVDDGIAGTEPSQSGYLYSASVAPTTCAAPSPTPERKFESDQFRYDAYTYTNTGAEPTCVTATGVARGCASLDVQSAVYLDSFDPANILTNYLASQYRPSYGHYVYPYSFMVPAGRTFVVVVHQRSVGAVCPQYHLSVDGAGVVAGKPDPGPGPGGGDTTPPVFESARISNPTFAIDRTGTAEVAIARAPKGTTFVTRLSEAARVEYVIQARRKGRKVGGRCRKPSAKNRRRKACTRFVAQGAFASDAGAGTNSKRFSGKIGDKTLRRGRYRATLTAIDAAGNRSKPKRLNFRVVRR
jgi:hypothetical protein